MNQASKNRQRNRLRWIMPLLLCILAAPWLFAGWVLLPGKLAHPQLEEVWATAWYAHSDRIQTLVTVDGLVLLRRGALLEALDRDGQPLWQVDCSDLPADLRWLYEPDTGLLLFDNAHQVQMLDVQTGELQWQTGLPDGQAASGKIARSAISPNGIHIAVANAGSVAVLDASGELVSSTGTSSLSGQIFRLHIEDSGQLTICLRQGQGPNTSLSYERLTDGTFQPVFANLPGSSPYAQLTSQGLFYFSIDDWNSGKHSVELLNADGSTFHSVPVAGGTIKMIDNEAYVAWIVGGTMSPGSSVGRLRLSDLRYEPIGTGSTTPGMPAAIDRDGSLLILVSPGMNTEAYAWMQTTLIRTNFRLMNIDQGIADLLPRLPMSRDDCVMLIDSAGQQQVFQTAREMRLLDSFQNRLLDGEFGNLYALEYEVGTDGKPDHQNGRIRIVKLRVPVTP